MSVLFHPYAKWTKKFCIYALRDDGQSTSGLEWAKCRSVPRRNNYDKQDRVKLNQRRGRNASKCTFWMEEGNFLGYLKNISRFIPKLAELMFPIHNIRRSLDVVEVSDWTIEAEEEVKRLAPYCLLKGTRTIGEIGSRVENISRLIRQKERSRGESGEKVFRHGGQVLRVSDKNNEGAFGSKEKPQEELGTKEPRKEGSDRMDYEALLARLVASAGKGMKYLHVFVGSKLLVDQVEESRVPKSKKIKKYREEIMDATSPFHRFWITHLLKALNPKAEVLTGLTSIRLEFLNQEVSAGVKKDP
ncbi:retrovirus-related pol polyprotein from transposon TNT 1-94 [Tanacetum coccineum]